MASYKEIFSLIHAVSKDETRANLGVVWLLASGDAVGCDGHIMVYGPHGIEGIAEDIAVPADVCKQLVKWPYGGELIKDPDPKSSISYLFKEKAGNRQVVLDHQSQNSLTPPNFKQLMPDTSTYKRLDGPIGMNLQLLVRINKALARTPSQNSNCQFLFKDKMSPVVIKPVWESAMQAIIMPVRLGDKK